MTFTFSTFLTIMRICMIPFIALSMIAQCWIPAIVLFTIAALTDMLDGYLARRWKEETVLGAYLDPLADKLMVTTCYAVLVFFPGEQLAIPGWFLLLVLIKETALLIGSFYWGAMKKKIEIRPSWLGKSAMVIQCGLIGWILLCSVFNWAPVKTLYSIIGVALIFIIGSFFQYLISLTVQYKG